MERRVFRTATPSITLNRGAGATLDSDVLLAVSRFKYLLDRIVLIRSDKDNAIAFLLHAQEHSFHKHDGEHEGLKRVIATTFVNFVPNTFDFDRPVPTGDAFVKIVSTGIRGTDYAFERSALASGRNQFEFVSDNLVLYNI